VALGLVVLAEALGEAASSMRAMRLSSNDRLASRKLLALPHSSACAHRRPSVASSWASRSRSSSHFSARSMRCALRRPGF
jgi:hypothetical protein